MKRVKFLVAAMALPMAMTAMTASAAPVEIDYWSVFTGGDGATMQSMVDTFNESQDEVHVNHTPMTADDLCLTEMALLYMMIITSPTITEGMKQTNPLISSKYIFFTASAYGVFRTASKTLMFIAYHLTLEYHSASLCGQNLCVNYST